MAKDTRIPTDDSDDDALDSRLVVVGGVVLFIAGAACGAMLYAFGLAGRTFNLSVLRGGLLTFGIISLCVAVGVIFMTAFIGLFGLLPLVISPGAGSELYRGLGSVTLGGLVASTIFTLILVPVAFSLALDGKAALARVLGFKPK